MTASLRALSGALPLALALGGVSACERKPAPAPEEHAAKQAATEETAACCKKPGAELSPLQLRPQGERELLRPSGGSSDPKGPQVGLALVGQGPQLVTDIEFVPGKPRWFAVTGQQGKALLLELPASGDTPAEPRGTLVELAVDSESELGLLSVAFHPEYVQNGRLFVHYNPKGQQRTRVAEFKLPADQLGKAQATEQRVLFEVKQPFTNHNGGELSFGPDGMLYLGLGDGGLRNDPHENGEKLNTLLGKILRLDVDGAQLAPRDNPFAGKGDARPEIFAYGLRNPWKISFDPKGRLIAADVGQNLYEEIDIVERGANLGWNTREATHCFDPKSGCESAGRVDPVFEYGRDLGQSVTGGFVYTAQAIPQLAGQYVFGDFVSRRLWALELPEQAGKLVSARVLGVFEAAPSTFGRDLEGAVYVSDYGSGKIFKLAAL